MRRAGACRVIIVGSLLVAAGCASAPRGPVTAELPPVRLHNAQTGVRERCGIELIREVERLNDLTWVERIFFSLSANREAREAVRDEQAWRRACIERYQRQGYEVVTSASPR